MFLQKIVQKARRKLIKKIQPVATINANISDSKKALVSYLRDAVYISDSSDITHSNQWECWKIVDLLVTKGYEVDLIDFYNCKFVPQKSYEVVLDIHSNLQRLAPLINAKKLLHITGSFPRQLNEAETRIANEISLKHGKKYKPRRIVNDWQQFEKSLHVADFCSLIGNQCTLNTFPEKYRSKISLCNATPIQVKKFPHIGNQRHFLWLNAYGAGLRRLDIILKIFARRPEWVLHVVGKVAVENDFVAIFKNELYNLANIHYHGFLNINSEKFSRIAESVGIIISPSASEGMSSAVITGMNMGLFPIISRNTGIDLPNNCGVFLQNCEEEEIEAYIDHVYNMNTDDFIEQRYKVRDFAKKEYSRAKFLESINNYFELIL